MCARTRMPMEGLFVKKKWKQSKCPALLERLNELWYIHPMKYSALNERMKHSMGSEMELLPRSTIE